MISMNRKLLDVIRKKSENGDSVFSLYPKRGNRNIVNYSEVFRTKASNLPLDGIVTFNELINDYYYVPSDNHVTIQYSKNTGQIVTSSVSEFVEWFNQHISDVHLPLDGAINSLPNITQVSEYYKQISEGLPELYISSRYIPCLLAYLKFFFYSGNTILVKDVEGVEEVTIPLKFTGNNVQLTHALKYGGSARVYGKFNSWAQKYYTSSLSRSVHALRMKEANLVGLPTYTKPNNEKAITSDIPSWFTAGKYNPGSNILVARAPKWWEGDVVAYAQYPEDESIEYFTQAPEPTLYMSDSYFNNMSSKVEGGRYTKITADNCLEVNFQNITAQNVSVDDIDINISKLLNIDTPHFRATTPSGAWYSMGYNWQSYNNGTMFTNFNAINLHLDVDMRKVYDINGSEYNFDDLVVIENVPNSGSSWTNFISILLSQYQLNHEVVESIVSNLPDNVINTFKGLMELGEESYDTVIRKQNQYERELETLDFLLEMAQTDPENWETDPIVGNRVFLSGTPALSIIRNLEDFLVLPKSGLNVLQTCRSYQNDNDDTEFKVMVSELKGYRDKVLHKIQTLDALNLWASNQTTDSTSNNYSDNVLSDAKTKAYQEYTVLSGFTNDVESKAALAAEYLQQTAAIDEANSYVKQMQGSISGSDKSVYDMILENELNLLNSVSSDPDATISERIDLLSESQQDKLLIYTKETNFELALKTTSSITEDAWQFVMENSKDFLSFVWNLNIASVKLMGRLTDSLLGRVITFFGGDGESFRVNRAGTSSIISTPLFSCQVSIPKSWATDSVQGSGVNFQTCITSCSAISTPFIKFTFQPIDEYNTNYAVFAYLRMTKAPSSGNDADLVASLNYNLRGAIADLNFISLMLNVNGDWNNPFGSYTVNQLADNAFLKYIECMESYEGSPIIYSPVQADTLLNAANDALTNANDVTNTSIALTGSAIGLSMIAAGGPIGWIAGSAIALGSIGVAAYRENKRKKQSAQRIEAQNLSATQQAIVNSKISSIDVEKLISSCLKTSCTIKEKFKYLFNDATIATNFLISRMISSDRISLVEYSSKSLPVASNCPSPPMPRYYITTTAERQAAVNQGLAIFGIALAAALTAKASFSLMKNVSSWGSKIFMELNRRHRTKKVAEATAKSFYDKLGIIGYTENVSGNKDVTEILDSLTELVKSLSLTNSKPIIID